MDSGLLGKAALAANADTVLYTGAAGRVTTASVSLCNTGSAAVTVRLAVGMGTTAAAGDFLAYELTIPAGGFFERTGIVFGPTENIIVRSSAATVSARAHGFDEDV